MRSTSRPSRIKGSSARAAFTLPSGEEVEIVRQDGRKPQCSQGHPANRVVREPEGWVCLDCMNEFLVEHNPGGISNRSKGGVVIPKGVKNPGGLKIDDLIPNRAARRRARRKHG